MTASTSISATLQDAHSPQDAHVEQDIHSALRFITCGSVDDGKSTLIGRLLVDSRSVMQDQLANVTKGGQADLAMFTDGLSAEREQGITIDVAYRYFATPARKFIIGDTPGHEQYTRNMVTAASSAHAAVVLVDATKLKWQNEGPVELLAQTRRHALLVNLLRVPGIIFAVNKLDALERDEAPQTIGDAAKAFHKISTALNLFAAQAGIAVQAIVPISALRGHNVVHASAGWCGYQGPSLLELLERLPATPAETGLSFSFPVQWVEKFHDSADTSQGRRVFWGRVASGIAKVGESVTLLPSGVTAKVAQVINHVRVAGNVDAGHGAGVVLDREVDVSRGDWMLATDAGFVTKREIRGTVAWMDDTPLVAGRVYLALHGHRWVKARITRIVHRLDINTLAETEATEILPNAIGHIELALQEPIPTLPYSRSRLLGALILVDTATHKTSGAVLLN